MNKTETIEIIDKKDENGKSPGTTVITHLQRILNDKSNNHRVYKYLPSFIEKHYFVRSH
jgi:hypothetical protein